MCQFRCLDCLETGTFCDECRPAFATRCSLCHRMVNAENVSPIGDMDGAECACDECLAVEGVVDALCPECPCCGRDVCECGAKATDVMAEHEEWLQCKDLTAAHDCRRRPQCSACGYEAPLPTLRQFDGVCIGCYEERLDWLDNQDDEPLPTDGDMQDAAIERAIDNLEGY